MCLLLYMLWKKKREIQLQTLGDKNVEEAVHRNEQMTINGKNYAELVVLTQLCKAPPHSC